MAIDFTTPTKTANYDTGILGVIRNNQIAIASFLDGVSITAGNTAGLKRYNASSKLFEKSDGSAWTEMPLGYLKTGGGTLTGALLLAGDGTAALNPVTLQQLNAALAGSSTPAGYARLNGAAFTGPLSTSGAFNAGTTMSAAGGIFGASATIRGPVLFGEGVLTTQGQAFLSAGNATTPIIGFDANDYLAYDRTANALSFILGGVSQFNVDGGRFTVARNYFRMAGVNDGTFAYFECQSPHLAFSKKTGSYDFYWRRNDDGTSTGANSVQLMDLNDAGNLTTAGLLYGRGGGAGLGQITVQAGGSPTGGAPGDLWFIY